MERVKLNNMKKNEAFKIINFPRCETDLPRRSLGIGGLPEWVDYQFSINI